MRHVVSIFRYTYVACPYTPCYPRLKPLSLINPGVGNQGLAVGFGELSQVVLESFLGLFRVLKVHMGLFLLLAKGRLI